ncbi:MAG: phospho-N-acetylmuramoyl-pentapeptide-transferase [Candidatus Eremiobacteraeota bacterium]|nr:phospho-N-acetylmuramoyl-pentapeptide-transferase [Candidatus Eremiobacteraeota bacterium]
MNAWCDVITLPAGWLSLGMPTVQRLALTGVLGLFLALSLGRRLIAYLQRRALRQHAYEDAPATHAVKTGTPTMGGLLFALAFVATWLGWRDGSVVALTIAGLGCMAIGFGDDLLSIQRGRNRGMRARTKFGLTAVVALAFLLATLCSQAPSESMIGRPILLLVPAWSVVTSVPIGLWLLVCTVAVVGTTHAVNLTDGLDGLASGAIVPPLAVFGWVAWREHQYGVAFVDVATIGVLLGFLFYNRHPARLFMGDTGSLALGGILAGSAILTYEPLLLVLVGGVFVAETLSVILQVTSFKLTHKRIFRMSPLHHHFELGGWSESKVTHRFWAASALCSLAGAWLVR